VWSRFGRVRYRPWSRVDRLRGHEKDGGCITSSEADIATYCLQRAQPVVVSPSGGSVSESARRRCLLLVVRSSDANTADADYRSHPHLPSHIPRPRARDRTRLSQPNRRVYRGPVPGRLR
jgi:hypothetical protein